ncbi:MAG TPA: GGDEF domain-containing protein, partial [Longimicrobiales bacterium]|nr:GGDEF domain-containing protein [Longimicrobiales bacterium]
LACVRSSDTVSRIGGDEFVVLLSEVACAGDAVRSADKILASLARPQRIDQQDLHVTVSVGIGVYPADGGDAETLLKNADLALLRAKARGRGNAWLLEPDIDDYAAGGGRQSCRANAGHLPYRTGTQEVGA